MDRSNQPFVTETFYNTCNSRCHFLPRSIQAILPLRFEFLLVLLSAPIESLCPFLPCSSRPGLQLNRVGFSLFGSPCAIMVE